MKALFGRISDAALPAEPDRSPLLMHTILTKRIRMQGFIIFDDYAHRYPSNSKFALTPYPSGFWPCAVLV